MRLHDLDPDRDLRDPARKQGYVTAVFDTVAPRYDRFTRVFSFGMDARWKRRMASWVTAAVSPGDLVLDLACGTGDLSHAVATADAKAMRPPGRVTIVGVDPSAAMLGLARRRLLAASAAAPTATLVRGDMMHLPVADRCVAAVMVGYGFRNTPAASVAIAEVARVLRRGGWLFDLDFFQPEHETWRRFYLWYLRRAGRAIGRRWHGEPEAYGYIARSIEAWRTPSAFRTALRSAGFRIERAVARLGGGICLHAARLEP